uniref:Uncharacterized protein n=1 Tax=Panagrolaimus sp. ES5 TaxID=591445 RepID=A0AC34GJ64_9BILA
IVKLQTINTEYEDEIRQLKNEKSGNCVVNNVDERQAYESKGAICEALKTKNRELIAEISDLKEYIDRSKTMFEEKIVKLQTINAEYEDEIRQLKSEKSGNGVVNNVDEVRF